MWELDHKESWTLKNWCFWTIVLEKRLLGVPWTVRRSNQSILKESTLNILFTGRTDAEALNILVTWYKERKDPDAFPLIGKGPDAGRDWGKRGRGLHWMRRLDVITESQQTPGDSEGQGSLVCCSPWGHKESDTTEQLNNNNKKVSSYCFLHLISVNWSLSFSSGEGRKRKGGQMVKQAHQLAGCYDPLLLFSYDLYWIWKEVKQSKYLICLQTPARWELIPSHCCLGVSYSNNGTNRHHVTELSKGATKS